MGNSPVEEDGVRQTMDIDPGKQLVNYAKEILSIEFASCGGELAGLLNES